MVRDPVPQNQIDFAVNVVDRVRENCITASDIRATFVKMADRGRSAQVGGKSLGDACCAFTCLIQ